MTLTQKIILYLLLACTYPSHNYSAQATLRSAQRIYTTHGDTLYHGAIWGADTVYLLGKLYPNKIPTKATTTSFAALNYVGLLYLGYQYTHLKHALSTAWQATQSNQKITCLAALAQAFCSGVFLIDALAMAAAATYMLRGNTKTANRIYAKMMPLADATLAITIGLDCYHMAQSNTFARLAGASDLLLKGLGYVSMAKCRHNPNSLTQATCWWGMATLYGIKSLWFGTPQVHV
jgi:hypothetical protein